MKDLEKVQKTLSDVFTHFTNLSDTEYNKEMLTNIGEANRIVENLAINGVVKSLPNKEELDSRLEMLIANNFETNKDDGKREYGFGFRACYGWIFSQVKQN